MKKTATATFLLLAAVACSSSEYSEGGENARVDEAVTRFGEEGMTCELRGALLDLSEAEGQAFRDRIHESMTSEEIHSRVNSREPDCGSDQPPGIGSVAQAITGMWVGQPIENQYLGGGNYPGSVYRDASAYSWMCNSGTPANPPLDPADWIAQVNQPGGYASPTKLKAYGMTSCGTDVMNAFGAIDSRVYSDNDIRACLGYWTVWVECGSLSTSDIIFGLIP